MANGHSSLVNGRKPSGAGREGFLHAQRGYKYSNDRRFDLSIEEYQEAIALRPDVALFHAALANVYKKVGKKNTMAKEALEKAVELDSENHEYRYNLGVCYLEAHEHAAAEEQFEVVQRLSPNFRRVHLLLGEAYVKQEKHPEKYEKAIKEFRKAIAQYPNDPNAHSQLGGAYRLQGKLNDAAVEYERAVQLDKENHLCRYKLAIVLQRLGRMEEAQEQLTEYKRLYDKRMNARQKQYSRNGAVGEAKEQKHKLATSQSDE